MNTTPTHRNAQAFILINWVAAAVIVAIGAATLVLVHPVPAIGYLLLSLVYFPPATAMLKQKTGFSIPSAVKIALAIVIIMFTLGVSDLGDMIDG